MINVFNVSHTRARALLSSGAPVFLPVNPVEYHGPHLSLHNDSLIANGVAREIHAELAKGNDWPFLVASDLELGVDPAPGAGSRPVGYRDACKTIVSAARALVELGAKRVVFATFHGSPLHSHAIHSGVTWLRKNGVSALSPFNVALRKALDLDLREYADVYETIADAEERALVVRDSEFDTHAGFMETSVALHYAPDSVDPGYVNLPPCPPLVADAKLMSASLLAGSLGQTVLARELKFAALGLGWYALRPFPGYTGRPNAASVEAGGRIARHLIKEFAAVTSRVLEFGDAPPLPVMPWLVSLTMGGVLAPETSVPLGAMARFELGRFAVEPGAS